MKNEGKNYANNTKNQSFHHQHSKNKNNDSNSRSNT